jgi:lipid-binding SYLF domain-containing protein
MNRPISLALVVGALACSSEPKSPAQVQQQGRDRAVEELSAAVDVLDAMRVIPAKRREGARCVAVIPSLVRAGFIVGGRHGEGIVSCRTQSGWSAPAFITLSGGSAGFQLGVESSDIVMLVMSDRGMAQLFRTSFALGADVSGSAGPVGEGAQAGTDATITAEILSYARSRGLFAGAELSGTVVTQDQDALMAVYGPSHDVHSILAGQVAVPGEASHFVERLTATFSGPRS